MNTRALGKGLSALIPEKAEATVSNKAESAYYVKTALIRDNAQQPRLDYNDAKLAELIASIKERGVLQPILVREKDEGYEVIAGERRLRAARALNIKEIPVIVKDVNDQEALVLALIENIQREELNAIEEANAFRKLTEDFHLTQEEIAKSVGKDRSTITNVLRLLKLPEYIQQSVQEGRISEGHARVLVSVENFAEQQQIFNYAMEKGLSVRELESIVKTGLKHFVPVKKARVSTSNPDVIYLEEDLQKVLGTKVRIQVQKKRGKIVIEYYSPDDLERIINIIKK